MEALRNIMGGAKGGLGAAGGDLSFVKELLGRQGKDVSEADLKALTQQAGSLWKHLDELSDSDPSAYKAFLETQASAVQEEREAKADKRVEGKAPTIILDTRRMEAVPVEPCRLHVWAAREGCGMDPATAGPLGQLLTPATHSFERVSIPLTELRPPETLDPPSQAGPGPRVRVFHLACHSATMKHAVSGGAAGARLLELLAEACTQFVEHKHALSLDRQQRQLRVSKAALSPEQLAVIDKLRHQAALTNATQGTAAAQLSQGLLSQLVAPQAGAGKAAPGVSLQGPAKLKRPLIVDMGEQEAEGSQPSSSDSPEAQVSTVVEGGVEHVVIAMLLSSVSKARELDIEVLDGRRLVVTLPGGQQVTAHIPRPVAEDITAKFDKADRRLTVRMRTLL